MVDRMNTSFSNRMLIVCLLAFVLCLIGVNVSAQDTEIPDKGGQLKFNALNFIYPFVRSPSFPGTELRLGFQYEQQTPWSSKTFNFAFDINSFSNNGYSSFDIYIRPQLRHYFTKVPYSGFFVGVYPMARFYSSGMEQSEYYGFGLIAGAQGELSKRLHIEGDIYYGALWGSSRFAPGYPPPIPESTRYAPWGSLEITIGWMLRKQK